MNDLGLVQMIKWAYSLKINLGEFNLTNLSILV
jgi:hypothetical protein